MRQCGLLLLLVACAHNVPQDKATGPDGRLKGAKPIAIVDGEGKAKGIVTYPGGDRVDWKVIELPEKAVGKLDLALSWKTPRPGLQLSLDVFDQWNTPVATSNRKGGRMRTIAVPEAKGKYFVRVYAPKRGDAGQYTLVATFTEKPKDETPPVDPMAFPDPPKLPAVPPPEETCETWDPKNKACTTQCPFDAPDGWKGCIDRDNQKAAEEARKAAAAARAACLANLPKSVIAQVKHVEVNGDVARVKLAVGLNGQPQLSGNWTGEVLVGNSDRPLQGGTAKILSVDKQVTRVEIRLRIDQLNANPRVRLSPPPGACP